MEFSTYSEMWKLTDCGVQPSELLRLVLRACSKHFPSDALGHIKAFAEFTGGRAFAFSTLTPTEVIIWNEGNHAGGVCTIGITLVFMGLKREFLREALLGAENEVSKQSVCLYIERNEV